MKKQKTPHCRNGSKI